MSTNLLPKYAFLIAGTGKHIDRLQAFDQALLDAGPLTHNIVAVSSIIPSGCKIISAKKGFSMLAPGQIVFCVMARQETNRRKGFASASIGVVKTKKSKKFGYISEYHGNATSKLQAENTAKRLAIEMLAVKLNTTVKKLDPEFLRAIGASIKQKGDREWVCAVALCVFVL